MKRNSLFATLFLLLATLLTFGQLPTSTPPFSVAQPLPGGIGSIDLGNLDVHIDIPIRSRTGITPFQSHWTYDNGFWYLGTQNNWTAYPFTYGVNFVTTADPGTGLSQPQTCGGQQTMWVGSTFHYVDLAGVTHSWPSLVVNYPPHLGGAQCNSPSSASATDPFGYIMSATIGSGGAMSMTVTLPDGSTVASSFGSINSTFTDIHGNHITNANNIYTDTLGTTALTASFGSSSTYTYTGEGGSETITETYTNYTPATAFAAGCSGTTDFTAGSAVAFPTRFALPDSSAYNLTWEQTPGKSSAYTTARIKSIQLPQGGTITFTYNGTGIFNNGMNCDGTISGFTMATPDGTWTFTHSAPNGSHVATTTVTDPAGNVTNYNFYMPGGGMAYETQRQVHTGSSTLLETDVICYNGQALSGCASSPTAFTSISQIATYTELPSTSGVVSETINSYDSSSRLTEHDETDFAGGAPGGVLRKTLYIYGTWNGSACAALSGNILYAVCEVLVENGSGAAQTSSLITRDTHGNPTEIQSAAKSGLYLTKHYTFNANGTVATFTDTNNDLYTYNYGDCNGAFPTSVSEPASLSSSFAWDCTGAVLISFTDEAGGATSTSYSGQYFWRPSSRTDAMSQVTSFSYASGGTRQEAVMNFGSSTVDDFITFDSLGRPQIAQRRQAPGSSSYDSVETDYNSVGEVSRVTQPYSAGLSVLNGTAPAQTFNYDGAGRLLTATDAGTGEVSYAYAQNTFTKTISPAPTGESVKDFEYQFDGLGRVVQVCEGSGGDTSWGTCPFNGWYGYLTQYGYDTLNDLTSVTQNANATAKQTRSFAYDYARRLTSETNPESGTTSYVYDTQSVGDLYTSTDALNITVTYTHGAFHRLTKMSIGTFCRNFLFDSGNAHANANYTNGRLAYAYTDNCSGTKRVQEYLGYDASGRNTDLWEITPNSGGVYHVTDQYFPNDVVNTLVAQNNSGVSFAGLPNFTYSVDGEGRPTLVSASSGTNPVTAASYNVAGQLQSLTLGSGDSDSYSYDGNTGRMTQYEFSINGSNVIGALTWNANGTLNKLAITDPFNSGDAQTCNYAYDAIARLSSANCGTPWSQTFSYDYAGNLKKSGSLSFQPNYADSNGNINNRYFSGLTGLSYDADGQLLNDSFHTYTWNGLGDLTSVDGHTVVPDPFGRVAEFGSTATQFMYAPTGAKIATMTGQTLATARISLPGGEVASYHSSGFNAYGHADWLGSIRFGSTSGRAKDSDYAFAPFGEVYAGSAASYTEFTGQTDGDLGSNLFDFPMRKYHSSQGRWISPDPAELTAENPLNPQTWNRYAYVGGNPLSMIDPLGLSGQCTASSCVCSAPPCAFDAPPLVYNGDSASPSNLGGGDDIGIGGRSEGYSGGSDKYDRRYYGILNGLQKPFTGRNMTPFDFEDAQLGMMIGAGNDWEGASGATRQALATFRRALDNAVNLPNAEYKTLNTLYNVISEMPANSQFVHDVNNIGATYVQLSNMGESSAKAMVMKSTWKSIQGMYQYYIENLDAWPTKAALRAPQPGFPSSNWRIWTKFLGGLQ